MNVFIRPTGAPLGIGTTIGFAPNGSSASLDTAPIEPALVAGDLVLMQRSGALVKVLASAFGETAASGANDVSADTVVIGPDLTARSLAQRAADTFNILDWGGDKSGLADSAPAFNALIASVGEGLALRIFCPAGSYLLNSVVNTQGRLVAILLDDGADIAPASTGYFGVTRVDGRRGAFSVEQIGGGFFGMSAGTSSYTSLHTGGVTNTFGLNASVWDTRYTNQNNFATTGGTQDQLLQRIVTAFGLFDSSQWMDFSVLNGPIYDELSASSLFYGGSSQYGEWDIVNNTPETGWTDQDSIGTAAAGLAIDPSGGNKPYLGGHIRYAFGSAGSVTGGGGTPNNRWWTYPAVFGSVNPSAQLGNTIVITATNGAGTSTGPVTVNVGGAGALPDWVTAINGAAIPGIAAAVSTWGQSLSRLVIYSTVANGLGTITLAGTALGHLGLPSGTQFAPRAQNIVAFGAKNISGAAGVSFTLNGNTITVGGGGAGHDVATAINTAGLTGITGAVNTQGQLVVNAWCGSQILAAPYWSGQVFPTLTIGGAGAATLGLTAGTFYAAGAPTAFATAWSATNPASVPAGCVISINGTQVAVSGNSTSVANAIQAAAISNVQAFIRGGSRLGIRQLAGGTLALQDITGRALDLLGIVAGGQVATFQPGGYSAGSFNTFFAAPDAVAPGGRAFYTGGSSSADLSVHPFAPLEARGAHQHGIRLDQATFDDGVAFRMAAGQALAAGLPGADQQIVSGAGTLRFAALGQAQGLQLGQLFGTSASGIAVRLTADGNAAGAANSWPVGAGHALFGDVRVLAVDPATTHIACWSVPLAVSNAGRTIAVVNPGTGAISPTYSTGGMSAAALTVLADGTDGAISITVTPPASTVARCQASFVGAID